MKRSRRTIKSVSLCFGTAIIGFVVGVVGLYLLIALSGPPLAVWHTEKLAAEFKGKRAGDEIRTLEDYVELEQDLFEELDERIYNETETGSDHALARYTTGSRADPRGWNPNWNRTFELPVADPKGSVLLLHGMSDSPYSLRALGESFHRDGYHVLGLRLPGHGTVPSGLLTATWEDMAAAVRVAMQHLASAADSKPLTIVGYSTGAPLALDYVLNNLEGDTLLPKPDSLILISPSIGITRAAALAKWKRRLGALPGLGKLAWTGIVPEFDPYKYNSFTANAGDQVHRLTRSVAARVEARAAGGLIDDFPRTLVFLSTVDATVSVDAVVDNLLEHLEAGPHELVLFDVNRFSRHTSILISDPGPLTARLMTNASLPFHLALITNRDQDSQRIVSRRKPPFSTGTLTEPLDLAWPRGIISLSHVALPFPPADPLYGRAEFASDDRVHLGQNAVQGERNLLKLPADWLLRLRYNPFYSYLEERTLDWVRAAGEP